MKFKIITIALLTFPSSALLADSLEVALNLGNIIASEKYCDLKYNQAAIQAYIEKHVDAKDMDFPGNLQTSTAGSRYTNKQQSPSAKTAHCAQIKRLAKAYKFID